MKDFSYGGVKFLARDGMPLYVSELAWTDLRTGLYSCCMGARLNFATGISLNTIRIV